MVILRGAENEFFDTIPSSVRNDRRSTGHKLRKTTCASFNRNRLSCVKPPLARLYASTRTPFSVLHLDNVQLFSSFPPFETYTIYVYIYIYTQHTRSSKLNVFVSKSRYYIHVRVSTLTKASNTRNTRSVYIKNQFSIIGR